MYVLHLLPCAIITTVPISILQVETVDCAPLVLLTHSLMTLDRHTDEKMPSRHSMLLVSDITLAIDGTKIELHLGAGISSLLRCLDYTWPKVLGFL